MNFNIDSDHELVVAQLRLKLATPLHAIQKSQCNKFDVLKLGNDRIAESFRIELRNRFATLSDMADNDINTEWNHMKMVYTETSSKILGHKHPNREEWMSQKTWDLINERRDTKVQLLSATHIRNVETLRAQYSDLRKRVYRSTRRDRRNWAHKLADTAEAAANQGNMRELYMATKTLSGNKRPKRRPLRDTNGQLIVTSEGQLRRWADHFREVFRGPLRDGDDAVASTVAPTIFHSPPYPLDININAPSFTEVREAIMSLKSNKAPGEDLITAEMLKVDVPTATNFLTPLIAKIWREETMPDEWTTGLLVTMPKKGDLSNCNNWRGITLLSVPSKVLCKILLDRLSKAVEPILRDEQAGFRPGRSCIDHINTLRIILEQGAEFQREIYSLFVDFEKAFDTLRWTAIWSRLQLIGVPAKIVNLTKAAYHNYSCKVLYDGLYSDRIPVHAGVRQGCLLSPLLFLVVLDGVMSNVNNIPQRGIQWGLASQLQDLDYADDLCLLSHRRIDMQAKLDDLQREAATVGLKINVRKTKDMRSGACDNNPLLLGDEVVEQVSSFTYLGSIVSKTGGTDLDVSSRIAKAKGVFACLHPIWQSKHLSRRVKLRIFNTNVKSVLLYGCETWKVSKPITEQLQVFINRCLRRILKIFWPATIANVQLWRKCHEDPVDLQIRRRKWGWVGHTLRRDAEHIPKQAMEWNPQGRRRCGRPRQTWRRSVIAEAKSIGLTWSELKRKAQDREEWRSTVSALCPVVGS